ncbi:MAG: hypothetical protein ACYTFK_13600 [Planctomycetota bacterium]
MKITCEIDWLDEEESVDEALQKQVMEKVVETIANRFSNDMFLEVEKKASAELAQKVNELSDRLLDRFTNKEIIVTDGWGDIKEKHASVGELLKHKFDEFLTHRVNERGESSRSCSYSSKPYTRLDWMLDKRVNEAEKELTKRIAAEVDGKIKAKAAEMHKRTVEQITKKLGLEV